MSTLASPHPAAAAGASPAKDAAPSDRFNTAACLAIATAILGYSLAEPAPGLAAFSLPILALGWWLGRAGSPPALPRLVVNLLVVAIVARALLTVAGSGNAVVSHLSEFLVLIQLVKLFDRRTPRDDAQLLSLSLFIVIGGLLTSNALGVGLLLIIYTPLATAAAMLLQIRAGLVRARQAARTHSPAADSPETATAVVFTGAAGRTARRQFVGTVAAAVALSFALGLVAFLVTPRGFGADRLGSFGRIEERSRIGFSDQISLAGRRDLDANPTPVMDVTLRDDKGQNIGSEGFPLYLRGAVLDTYDSGERSWRLSTPSRLGASRSITFDKETSVELLSRVPMRPVYEQEVTLRSTQRQDLAYVFAMWSPVEVQFPARMSVIRSPFDGSMRFEAPGGRMRYTVWSQVEATDPEARRSRRSVLGFENGPIRDLAVEILTRRNLALDPEQRGPGDVRAAAAAFQSFLRQNYSYTLSPTAPGPREDPIEKFLFQTKSGHCEYFASALVALCQSVGIHARVVTGYVTTEFNRVTGQYLVRQSHAHAWAEVSLDDDPTGRWQPFDATPTGELERLQRGGVSLFGRLRQLYDAIDFAWNDRIVSFDERRRADLFGGALAESRILGVLRDAFSSIARWIDSLAPGAATRAVTWFILAASFFAAAAIVFVLPRVRARLRALSAGRPRLPTDRQLRRLLADAGFYGRALRLLDRAGVGKPVSRPPLAHAESLSDRDARLATLLRELASLYYHIRFGRRSLTDDERARAAALLADLDAHLTASRR